jgi:hypothetical protein
MIGYDDERERERERERDRHDNLSNRHAILKKKF